MSVHLAETILHEAAESAGLDSRDARYLARHATTVYLLPTEQVVARISEGLDAGEAMDRAVAFTRWLCAQGFPATAPADVNQPIHLDGHVVTFWPHYPQSQKPQPAPARLGLLLRRLHDLPQPPVPLPRYQPLTRFADTVEASTILSSSDAEWLLAERRALLDAYAQLDFPLGEGQIHGDAYPGNLLWDGDRVILGDWDESATGPREHDLANTYQGVRFGRTNEDLRAFAEAYGYDIAIWTGLPVLRALRDLHTLSSYIRRAEQGDHLASKQLRHRIDTLKRGEATALWTAT